MFQEAEKKDKSTEEVVSWKMKRRLVCGGKSPARFETNLIQG